MCELCCEKIKIINNFKQQCIQSNEYWIQKEQMRSVTSKIVEDEEDFNDFKQPALPPRRKKQRNDKSERNCTCSICGKSFFDRGALKGHEQTHSKVKKYICDFCGKCFHLKKLLMDHLGYHTNNPRHKCNQCPKAYYNNSALSSHRRLAHLKKEFVCSECGKSFALKCQLKSHERVHTGEKVKIKFK